MLASLIDIRGIMSNLLLMHLLLLQLLLQRISRLMIAGHGRRGRVAAAHHRCSRRNNLHQLLLLTANHLVRVRTWITLSFVHHLLDKSLLLRLLLSLVLLVINHLRYFDSLIWIVELNRSLRILRIHEPGRTIRILLWLTFLHLLRSWPVHILL